MENDTRLSYSSWGQLQTCEQQYVHRKILKTEVDNKEQDRTAFDVGSATHQCVEDTNWGLTELTQEVVDKAIADYPDAADHKGLVHAMSIRLIQQQKMSGLICVKAEQQITHPKINGFIDLIAKKHNGDWYIIDLKTSASKPNEGKIAQLPNDRQLNLYSKFAPEVATHLNLDINKFQGCVYRVVVKSKASPKSTESYKAFVNRVRKLTQVYDIMIPKETMNIEEIWESFCDAHVKSLSLREGEVPVKNLGACFNYFRTCDYFSRCHGYKAEDIIKTIKVKTTKQYEQEIAELGDLL